LKAGGPSTLEEQVGSKTRGLNLKKLAAVGRERALSAAATLWHSGKDATQTAVLKLTRSLVDKPRSCRCRDRRASELLGSLPTQ
jgi:hypothetical protein